MDDVEHRFARELADAIAAAVAASPEVQACRDRARAEGFEMKVMLEALVGFAARGPRTPKALTRVTAPGQRERSTSVFEVSANDRRFLRSLRIMADETAKPVD